MLKRQSMRLIIRFYINNHKNLKTQFKKSLWNMWILEADLKGPKHEIFESGFFTEIRPVRIGDLGTGEKKMKFRKLESLF